MIFQVLIEWSFLWHDSWRWRSRLWPDLVSTCQYHMLGWSDDQWTARHVAILALVYWCWLGPDGHLTYSFMYIVEFTKDTLLPSLVAIRHCLLNFYQTGLFRHVVQGSNDSPSPLKPNGRRLANVEDLPETETLTIWRGSLCISMHGFWLGWEWYCVTGCWCLGKLISPQAIQSVRVEATLLDL